MSLTGYGPRSRYGRLIFDGDERKYEQWEVKFLGYMRLQKLKKIICAPDEEEIDEEKNEEAFAELIQFLDDKSLSLVMRDAQDDGRAALKILRAHYAGSGKPRVISLYTELTSLTKLPSESVTDYVIRAETAATALKNAGETVTDSLLIAMVLKGLPEDYKPFVVVITQSDKQQSFSEFKVALRSFEDTEHARGAKTETSAILKTEHRQNFKKEMKGSIVCFKCGRPGHFARRCPSGREKTGHWCNSCHSSSHSDKTCRKKGFKNKSDRVNQVSETQKSSDDEDYSFVFQTNSQSYEASGNSTASRRNTLLVDCGATAHIVNDKSKFTKFDNSFKPEKHFIELADGSCSNNVALGRGEVDVKIKDFSGSIVKATLRNVLYVPSYPQDIFSVQAATERGASVVFQPNSAELIYKDGTKFAINKQGRLYYLETHTTNSDNDNISYANDIKDWHQILGHCNYEDIMKLQYVVDGMKVSNDTSSNLDCSVCIQGKMTQGRNRNPDPRATVPLALVHTDIAGPIEPVSSEGFKYSLAFTDDFSGAVFVYFLKEKSDTVEATEKFLADSSPYGDIKCIRSDNGGEFVSQTF